MTLDLSGRVVWSLLYPQKKTLVRLLTFFTKKVLEMSYVGGENETNIQS